MNSITELLDAEDIVAEIRMERQAFDGCFLLLEGITDIRRFQNFFEDKDCSVVNCWGRSKIQKAVFLLRSSDVTGFLAFADADFDRVLGELEEDDCIIYSEFHDYDLDMSRTPAFARYMLEVAEQEKISAFGGLDLARDHVFNSIKLISAARLANRKGKIPQSLSRIQWEDYFDGDRLEFGRYVKKALRGKSNDRFELERFTACVEQELENLTDLWQVTNGHDFFTALGKCLRGKFGKRHRMNCSGNEIELHLRLTMNYSDFQSMSVYKKIRAWEAKHGYKVLRFDFS